MLNRIKTSITYRTPQLIEELKEATKKYEKDKKSNDSNNQKSIELKLDYEAKRDNFFVTVSQLYINHEPYILNSRFSQEVTL